MVLCGRYRHFKGTEYLVTDIVTHTETGERMVVYHSIEDPSHRWVRPFDMFIQEVDRPDYKGPRFIKLGD